MTKTYRVILESTQAEMTVEGVAENLLDALTLCIESWNVNKDKLIKCTIELIDD